MTGVGRAGRTLGRAGASLALVVALAACATVRTPDVEPVSPGAALEAWSSVLREFVDEQGRVDFRGLARDRRDLDLFIGYVARVDPETSPEAFPTPEARLAYQINAYNALSMYGVLEAGIPRTNAGLRKIRFFFLRRYRVAGRKESLYAYEKRIRELGDPRVHFALNCMSVSCPRLPREPFRGDLLEVQLQAQAREFFADPAHLRVDPGAGRVRVSSILEFYEDEFLRGVQSLVEYINQHVADPIPLDYAVEFLPYDWTINATDRADAGAQGS